MLLFTFIPEWVIQDAIVLIVSLMVIVFIIKNEEHPEVFLLEFFCFCVLYAAIYENFATLMGWYRYGQSLIMIFNVPITVPIVEYLVVYASLRLVKHMKFPTWCKPFLVGFMGMLFDFTLDPVALKQVFATDAGLIGRWTWFISATDVNIYGDPVYNFSGWFLLCGYAAMFLMLGRHWYKKSNYKRSVGYGYPVLMMVCSLLLLCTPPASQFLLWLAPVLSKGSFGEWIMLGVWVTVPTLLLVGYWRGRMTSRISLRGEYPIFLVLIGFHVSDIIFTLIGGFYEILWIEFLFSAIQSFLVVLIYLKSKQSETGHIQQNVHITTELKPASVSNGE